MTLGEFLKRARAEKSFSLRDVERAITISNGYLSLLESDSVKNPSPNFLYQLATLYEVSYAELMRLAGYVAPESTQGGTDPAGDPWLDELTDEERSQVGTFVKFLRASRSSRQ